MTQPLLFAALDDGLQVPQPPALAAIRRVVAAQHPLVWVTQRSGAEIMAFNAAIEQPLPFIAEGGSVLYWPQRSATFISPTGGELPDGTEADPVGDYWCVPLAGPYVQARAGLRVLANELHHSLLGYGDMTIERLQRSAGLSTTAAQQAKARESSEVFLTPKAVTAEALMAAAEDLGFSVVYGEKVSYLLAEGVSLAGAIAQLLSYCHVESASESAGDPPKTMGIGRWPRDKALLAAVQQAVALVTDGARPEALPPECRTITATPEAWATALQELAGLSPN